MDGMDVLLPFLLVAGATTLVCWGLFRGAARMRRRRVGSAALSASMSVFDEIWHPAAHEPQIEIQQAYERQAPAPSSPDKDRH
ncbi:hypothetical protein JCM33774_78940 [Actinophytocola sp. KF-1]